VYKAKLFSNGGLLTYCDTFTCHNPGKWFLGDQEGPVNLLTNLCEECKESLVKSIFELDREWLKNYIDQIEKKEAEEKEKAMHDGKEYPCKHCGEVFHSPARLATHVRSVHKSSKGDGETSNS